MAVVKGFLKITKPKGGAAGIPSKVEFMFNPESVTIDRSNDWRKFDVKEGKTAKFKSLEPASMSFSLVMDTTDTGQNVSKHTGQLLSLMDVPAGSAGADWRSANAIPPVVALCWGEGTGKNGIVGFEGVIDNIGLEFTYFSAKGVPLRAKASVKMTQFAPDYAFGKQNPTSGTPYPHHTHRTQPGETLDRISAKYYGDATRWRALAAANGIEDPLTVRPGSLLVIPEITRT